MRLAGCVNIAVRPVFYGVPLCALEKKGGSGRPIAVGPIFDHLIANVACRAVHESVFRRTHAARHFLANMSRGKSIVEN